MSNELLHSLLKEYEQKKLKAELDLENRKIALYKELPELQKIDDELNSFAIFTAKNILFHNNSSLSELDKKIKELKHKKSCILQNANLDSNYLQPHYECSICNDTGYFLKDNYKTEMCTCLKQKLLDASFYKSNMTNLQSENFESFNENIFSDEIDVAKYRFNISPRKNIQNIKQKCIEFIEHFDDPDYKNLLFTGNTGLRENFYVELHCSRIIEVWENSSLSNCSYFA